MARYADLTRAALSEEVLPTVVVVVPYAGEVPDAGDEPAERDWG